MKLTELESKLQEHAKIIKSSVAAPFDIESEELNMTKKKFSIKAVALAAAIICIIGTSVFAAIHYLSPKKVAEELGDKTLAKNFEETAPLSDTKADGKYKATILGIASGQEISDFKASSWDVYPDRTYVVVAVENSDQTPMTYDDEILVTPLIQGLNPLKYNIVTMHGGYSAKIIDGILYRIIESDSIEYFADQKLYIAVTDTTFLNNAQYTFDEKTGLISENEDYDGTNLLFDLKADKSKANPKKAAQYLKSLEDETEADVTEEETPTSDEDTEEFIIKEDFSITQTK